MSVSTIPSPGDLIQTFKFPFSQKSWIQKVLIIFLLMVASFIIPLIPSIFIAGYYYRVCRRIIAEDGQAALPEWDDWSRLLVDGLKYVGASIIYFIPLFISVIVMYLVMFLPMIGTMLPIANWNGNGTPFLMMGSMLMMFLMYPMMSLMMLLSLATGIFLPPALMHLIARNSFGGAFQFSAWWKVFRANFGGYLIAFLISLALYAVVYIGFMIFAYTIVLFCLGYILLFAMAIYCHMIASALFAQAYRTGVEKLRVKSELSVAPAKVTAARVKKTASSGAARKRKPTTGK
jgi:hypothetical protein